MSQCDVTTSFEYSANNFNCSRQYGEICFYFDINTKSPGEIECLFDYILDVEFPMGSFIYSQFDPGFEQWQIIENTTLYIYNIGGEIQREIQVRDELSHVDIDISTLNSGTYYVTASKGMIQPTKFIKVK